MSMLTQLVDAAAAARRRADEDRGDVPGWVLITIMTAGLVTLLWGFADETFVNMLRNALSAVGG